MSRLCALELERYFALMRLTGVECSEAPVETPTTSNGGEQEKLVKGYWFQATFDGGWFTKIQSFFE